MEAPDFSCSFKLQSFQPRWLQSPELTEHVSLLKVNSRTDAPLSF